MKRNGPYLLMRMGGFLIGFSPPPCINGDACEELSVDPPFNESFSVQIGFHVLRCNEIAIL